MTSTVENPFSLNGKRILITGASSGIGMQCAIRCSFAGATVIITGRDQERLQQTFEKLCSGNHIMFTADLSDLDSYEKNFSTILNSNEKIDGFVHSAGAELTLAINMMKPSKYKELFNLNVFSGFELCRQFLRKKCFSDKASLVYISSVMGLFGQPGKVAYCSTKAALINGVKAMALELASRGIRANTILPGVCNTGMTRKMFEKMKEDSCINIVKMHPLGLGEPDDIALAAIYLLSDASRWITGTSLTVDGGYSAQ